MAMRIKLAQNLNQNQSNQKQPQVEALSSQVGWQPEEPFGNICGQFQENQAENLRKKEKLIAS